MKNFRKVFFCSVFAFFALTSVFAKNERTKITVMVGFGTGTDPSQIAVHEKLAAEFNKTIGKKKNIELEFVTVQYSDSQQKFITLVAADLAPDICGPVGVMGFGTFIDEWLDIRPFLEKDKIDTGVYNKKLLDSLFVNMAGKQKLVGLPLEYYPSVLYYNEDIFDRAGLCYPPSEWGTSDWTYENLIDTARKMTLDRYGQDAYSPDFDMDNMVQAGYNGTDWSPLRVWVGKYFDRDENPGSLVGSADGRIALMNSPEWKRAFKDLQDQVFKYKVRPSSGSYAGSALFGDNDPMGSNKCAMWECFSWMSYAYESWSENFNWNVAAIPSLDGHVVSATNIDTFVMCKRAKNHDKAWEVYKWLYSPEVYWKLCKNYGGIPSMKQFERKWLKEKKAENPRINWQVFVDAADYAGVPNNEAWVPDFYKVWDAMECAMSGVRRREDTDKLAEDLNYEVQGYLDEYWGLYW